MQSNFSYKLTPLALQDIDDTLAYISDKLANAKAAADLLDALEHTLEQICAYIGIGIEPIISGFKHGNKSRKII